MKKIGFWVIVLFALCLTACTAEAASEPPSLVTQIQVSYHYGDMHIRRYYTDISKMDTVLFYLYNLTPEGTPSEDPEQIWGDCCQIVLTKSNGEQHIYRQQGGRYLSVDNHPWQVISPKKSAPLFFILMNMESDLLER